MAEMPDDSVDPAINTRGGRFVNKDVAANDELVALARLWHTEAVKQSTIDTVLNDGDRALSAVNAVFTGRNTRWPSVSHVDSDVRLVIVADT